MRRWVYWIVFNCALLQAAVLLVVVGGALVDETWPDSRDRIEAFGELAGSLIYLDFFTFPLLPIYLVSLFFLDRSDDRITARTLAVLTAPLLFFIPIGFAWGDATAIEILLVFGLPALAFGWLSQFPSQLRSEPHKAS